MLLLKLYSKLSLIIILKEGSNLSVSRRNYIQITGLKIQRILFIHLEVSLQMILPQGLKIYMYSFIAQLVEQACHLWILMSTITSLCLFTGVSQFRQQRTLIILFTLYHYSKSLYSRCVRDLKNVKRNYNCSNYKVPYDVQIPLLIIHQIYIKEFNIKLLTPINK